MKMAAYNERSTDFEVNISSNALEQENGRYMAKQSYCDPCNRDGKQNKTKGFCVDCDEHLCMSCFNLHKKFKPLQNHVLMDKTRMLESKTSGKVKDIFVDKCPSHMDKVIEYICQSCDKLCCSVCIIKSHRKCDSVDFIPDIIEDIEQSKVFLDVNETIEDQSVLLAEHGRKCELNQYKSKKLRDSAKEDIRRTCQEVHTWLIEKEKNMMKKLKTIFTTEQQIFDNFSAEVTTLKDDIEKVKSSLTTKMKSSQKCNMFVALHNAKFTINEIHRRLQELEKVETIQNYHFKEAVYVHDIKSKRELGTFEKTSSDTERNVKFLFTICTSDDGHPGKMCIISEKMLLLQGMYLTTLNLDFSKKGGPVLSKLQLNSCAADITKISLKEVAVTFPGDGIIKFYDVTPTGRVAEKKTIHVGLDCQGIQYFKNNFIVSFCHKQSGSVSIIDLSGQHKKEIIESSKLLFQTPFSFALNPRNEILYVGDSSVATVTSLTLDGIVINRFKSNKDYGFYGLSTDDNGSVYACSVCIGEIIQFSDKCRLVKSLRLDDSYMHVVFSEKNDFMYASTFKGDISVFEII